MTLRERQPGMFAYVHPWRLSKHFAPEWPMTLCDVHIRTTHSQYQAAPRFSGQQTAIGRFSTMKLTVAFAVLACLAIGSVRALPVTNGACCRIEVIHLNSLMNHPSTMYRSC